MWLKEVIVFKIVILWCTINISQLYCDTSDSTESNRSELLEESSKNLKDTDTLKLNKSIDFATQIINSMKRLEKNLDWSDIHVASGTPSYGQLMDSESTKEALEQNKMALIASKVTGNLINVHCSKYDGYLKDCVKDVFDISLHKTRLSSSCQESYDFCNQQVMESPYYSVDGTCNNKKIGSIGKSFSAYKRLFPNNYVDLVEEPRTRSIKSKILPSPRLISTTLCKQRNIEDSELTLALMQWGQFIEHDFSYTATNKMVHFNKTIECCEPNGTHLSPRYQHPFCLPISIPENDPFYGKYGIECMSYVRSVIATNPDCKLGAIDQMNQATHYLDGSQIYGANSKSSRSLRLLKGGLLKFRRIKGLQYLPEFENSSQDDKKNYFISGDLRVNFQPQLTTMHILWLREHNRIAKELSRINPNWDDETLYQESRRIVIAEMQHITYHEWLPAILGERKAFNIQQQEKYAEDVDARVTNSFATVGLRFLNSLMADKLKLYSDNRTHYETLNLSDYFYKAHIVEKMQNLDGLIRGLATQHSLKLDLGYIESITTKLYNNGEYGYDIMSLDIQRGRDHGLPSYISIRDACGLSEVQHFSDLSNTMLPETIALLRELYSSPQDIDLLVGGMAEKPEKNSVLGPTLSCIITDQFKRTKGGDRYFYDNEQQPKPFTKAQLTEIKKTSLARIFCDNSNDIGFMQPNVFKYPNDSNSLVSCIDGVIPYINLDKWRETPQAESSYLTYTVSIL